MSSELQRGESIVEVSRSRLSGFVDKMLIRLGKPWETRTYDEFLQRELINKGIPFSTGPSGRVKLSSIPGDREEGLLSARFLALIQTVGSDPIKAEKALSKWRVVTEKFEKHKR